MFKKSIRMFLVLLLAASMLMACAENEGATKGEKEIGELTIGFSNF